MVGEGLTVKSAETKGEEPIVGSFDTDERKEGVRELDLGDFSRHDVVIDTLPAQE